MKINGTGRTYGWFQRSYYSYCRRFRTLFIHLYIGMLIK